MSYNIICVYQLYAYFIVVWIYTLYLLLIIVVGRETEERRKNVLVNNIYDENIVRNQDNVKLQSIYKFKKKKNKYNVRHWMHLYNI